MPTISTLTVDVEAKTSRLRTGLRGAALAIGAFATGAFVAVNKASDLEESINKTNEVFGKGAKAMLDWSKGSAEAFGASQQEALDAAANFGLFAQAAGQSGGEVNKFSKEMVGLAGDLSSFFNVPIAQALEDLRSGLSGQSEPMRKYGVFLTEAAVKQEAVRMGLIKANEELSEGEKVLARQSLMLQQTGKAQGDFARTSDGLANSQRIAAAEFENLIAKIGTALLPAFAALVNAAMVVIDFIEANWKPAWKAIQETVGTVAAFLSETFGPAIAGIVEWFGKALDAIQPVAEWLGGELLEAARQTWNVLKSNLGPALAAVWDLLKKLWDILKPVVQVVLLLAGAILKLALEAFPVVIAVITKVIEWAAKIIEAFLAVVTFVRDKFVEPIVNFLGRVIEKIGDVIGWIRDRLVGAWNAIKEPVLAVINSFVEAIKTLIEWIQNAIEWLGRLGSGVSDALASRGAEAGVFDDIFPQGHRGGTLRRSGPIFAHAGERLVPNGAEISNAVAPASVPAGDIVIQVSGQTLARISRSELNKLAGRNRTTGLLAP